MCLLSKFSTLSRLPFEYQRLPTFGKSTAQTTDNTATTTTTTNNNLSWLSYHYTTMSDSTRTSPNNTTAEAVPPTSHRFMAWTALCLCSLVALASQVSATTNARQTDDWFVVVVCSISASAAFLAILGYAFVASHFKGGIFECLLAIVSILTWICGMPVIMSPDRNIAVSKGLTSGGGGDGDNSIVVVSGSGQVSAATISQEFTFIRNANMYFFSWACTICVVYICGRLAKELLLERRRRQLELQRQQQRKEEEEARKKASAKKTGGDDDFGSNNPTNDNDNKKKKLNIQQNLLTPKTNLWYLLTLTSLVVLVDAIELYMAFDACSSGDNEDGVDITGSSLSSSSSSQPDLCTKTEYAVALGAVGTFCAFICSGLATTGGLGTKMECIFAIIFLALYLTGVALITFNEGPGTSLGNLYFATWMGAMVGVVLVGRSYSDVVNSFRRKDDPPSEDEKPKEDAVEFPDIEMGDPNNKDDPAWAMADSSPAIAAIITNADGETEIEVPSDSSQKTNSKDEEDAPRWSKVNQTPKEAALAIATLKEEHDDSEVELEYKSPVNKDSSDDEKGEKVKERATKVTKTEMESDSKSEEPPTDEAEIDVEPQKKAPVANKAKKRMSSKKKPSVKKVVAKETEKEADVEEEKEKEEVKVEKKAPVQKKRMSKKASSTKVVDADKKADTKSGEKTTENEEEIKAEKKAVPATKPPAKKRVSKKASGNSTKSAASSEPEAKLKRTNSKNAVKSSEPEAKTSVQSKMEATPTKASTNPFEDGSSDLKKDTSEEATKSASTETKKAPTKGTTSTKSDPDEMKDGTVVAKEPKGEVEEEATASDESKNQSEE